MGTAAVVFGSLVAAILAYAYQVIAGRALGPAAFAPIGILWTIQFLAMQVLYQPLEHYINRETGRGRAPGLAPVLVFGVVAGAITSVVSLLLTDRFFGDGAYVWMSGTLVFGYAIFGYVRGRLAGTDAFVGFGAVTAMESTVRVALAVLFVLASLEAGLAWAMVVAPFVATIWLWKAGVTGPTGGLTRNLTPLVAASVFAQALLGLAPLAVAFFGASAATVSIVFLTFAMYRGPIWILQGLMARVLPVFVRQVESGDHGALRRWMKQMWVAGLSLAAVAFVGGGLAGPPVFALLLGEAFRPDPLFSALVAAGVIVAASAGLMNQVLLALDRLGAITSSWATGFAAAVATATLPLSPELRVGLAFVLGELVALAALQLAYARTAVGASDVPPELVVARTA